MKLFTQDKGHRSEFSQLVTRIAEGGAPLIPFDQIENVTLASFAAVKCAEGAGTMAL
jgi:hypothetical protein